MRGTEGKRREREGGERDREDTPLANFHGFCLLERWKEIKIDRQKEKENERTKENDRDR